MADINAADLTAETLNSLDGTENIVAFDTAEGKKIPLSVLGDYVVQKLTQTLMGDSQTLQTAINTLNDNAIKHKIDASQIIESNTDVNDLFTPGTYVCPNSNVAATLTNWPSSDVAGRMEVIEILRSSTGTSSSLRTRQIVRINNSTTEFQRYWNGTTWSNWLMSPTRAEMDAATNKFGPYFQSAGAQVIPTSATEYISPELENGRYVMAIMRYNANIITGDWFGMFTIMTNNRHITPIYAGELAPTVEFVSGEKKIKFTTNSTYTSVSIFRI